MVERELDLYNDECHLEDLLFFDQLKEKLIFIGLCIDNEYLNKYCDLIVKNKDTQYIKYKSNKHHIIPKFYFKIKKIKTDNSKNNLVVFSKKDHALAHYYLLKCSKNKRILNNNLYALKYILPKKVNGLELNDNEFLEMIKDLDNYHYEFTEEHKRKIGLAGIGNQYNKGKKWSEEARKKCSLRHKGCKHSDKTKKKMSEHSFMKNKHLTQEQKDKISKTNKGQILTQEQKDNISNSLKGHSCSEETRKKMSSWQKGKAKPKLKKETKEKLSLRQKGRIWINKKGQTKKIFSIEYEKYKKEGWERGRK